MLVSPNKGSLYLADHIVVNRFPVTGDGYEIDQRFHLPPLDVLMVWHAYMLNPRIYLEDSVRYTKQTLWRTSFPWKTIYEAIDNKTFDYNPGYEKHFEQSTGRLWHPVQDDRLATVECPKCQKQLEIEWTKPPSTPGAATLENYLVNDSGFAGSEFGHCCRHCNLVITHERLRVAKFCDDAHALIHDKRPFAGTVLNAWGEPAGTYHCPFGIQPDSLLSMFRNY
jgi:hypothetical protein